MTREEVIADLKSKIKRLNEIMENGDCGCVDQYTWEKCAKQLGWYEDILEALNPIPDSETGLLPCGCGGTVRCEFYPGWHGVPGLYQVDCFGCHVGTRPRQTAEQAKSAWNTARGYKEDEA